MSEKKFLITALLAIALVLALFFGRQPDRNQALGSDLNEVIGKLVDSQARDSERIARLESLLSRNGMSPGAMDYTAAPISSTARTPSRGPGLADPAEIERAVQARIRSLEDQLMKEPVTGQWASESEDAINRFLGAASLQKEGLPAARDIRAECHTNICRINANFASPEDASQVMFGLQQKISESMPQAQTFQFPRADGTVDYVVYATTGGAIGR